MDDLLLNGANYRLVDAASVKAKPLRRTIGTQAPKARATQNAGKDHLAESRVSPSIKLTSLDKRRKLRDDFQGSGDRSARERDSDTGKLLTTKVERPSREGSNQSSIHYNSPLGPQSYQQAHADQNLRSSETAMFRTPEGDSPKKSAHAKRSDGLSVIGDHSNCEANPIQVADDSDKIINAEDASQRTSIPSSERAEKYSFSPGSLQIPDLRISATRSRGSPRSFGGTKLASYAGKPGEPPSPSRRKLKDKLMRGLENVDVISTKATERIGAGGAKSKFFSNSQENGDDAVYSTRDVNAAMGSGHENLGNLSHGNALQNQGPRKTYAAGHRTLLQDTSDAILENSMLSHLAPPADSKRTRELPQPTSLPVASWEDEEDRDASQTGMRSIYELREAGVNQRLSRQNEALLEEIESSNTDSQCRVSVVELIKELSTPSFLKQFLGSGYESRLILVAESSSDKVVRLLLSIAFLLILNDPDCLLLLDDHTRDRVVTFLSECVSQKEDAINVLLSRKSGMSRDLQTQCHSICERLMTLPIWGHVRPSQLTSQTIAAQSLETVVRKAREAGSRQEILHRDTVERLLDMLDPAYYALRNEAHGSADLNTWLALSALESSAIVYSLADQDCNALWTGKSADKLASYILGLLTSNENRSELLSLGLRLSLNLSNSSSSICTVLADPNLVRACVGAVSDHFRLLAIKDTGEGRNADLDNLVLLLGLLINFAERSHTTAKVFLEPSHSHSPHIDKMIEIFLKGFSNAFEVCVFPC